ncbi:T9SS outer membrane translocon Sov/SprA [Flavobacterium sp. C4GT6]|uniref:T9SS outer membrane translocon Sov/SprA n=1 Tax=Flavobacterium sp. C4GT6 TaxID=3103818 RepID=UPI002ED5641A
MKTEYSKDFYIKLRLAVSLLFLFFNLTAQAQDDEDDNEKQDTLTGYSTARVELENPRSIVQGYTYDPITNKYIYTESVDDFNINYPLILTPEEYEELVLRESIREYYQQKSKALDGKGTEEEQKNLLPRYYVNSKFFETIFGGNTIDIKPQGSVELDLGVRYTKQDNPSLSPRNRSTFTFDFDQRISMSLQGQVGTKLGVTANYDTESTFAFQNLIKLEYTPDEDDIIQKIEVGNVSFPLSNSLVRGAQSLFGVKAQFQFGKTTVTGIFSEQKSQTKTITAQGGGTVQEFSFFAAEYDSDKHFFLSQWFRNNYDKALKQYPLIDSRVQITRVEVWVTNRQNRINSQENNSRNILALQDLGESQLTGYYSNADITGDAVGFASGGAPGGFFTSSPNSPSDNSNNGLDPSLLDEGNSQFLSPSVREIVTLSNNSFIGGLDANEGRDYAKLENARKLTSNEFTFHPQLGYISLNQRLSNDEILAVAYQYTIGGEVYQVGEFATDGTDATSVTESDNPNEDASISTKSLILKMLKSSLVNVDEPVWNLMMKNIYSIPGAYQLEQEDFKMNILYTDPSPLNYITPATDVNGNIIDQFPPAGPGEFDKQVAETPLLRVFNVDRLSYANDPQPGGDGFFDFYPGITVNTQNGNLIFTTVEPFGQYLFEKLRLDGLENYGDENETTYNANQEKYVYRRLYMSTQADASQESAKNKFQLRGKFKSTGGDGISLGAFNIPQGSVVVTAGGRTLVEGVDYTVNYQLGRVQILDASLQNSNTPIEVSVENNAVFGQQTRRFAGVYVEHKFTDKFLVGATLLNMAERPFTQKTNYGQESVNNTIFGLNTTYSTEVPFFTRLVNKLPNIDTDVPSNLSFRGEIAYLQPGASKADQFNSEPTTYVDDFEGSQTTIDMRSPLSWSLASAPITLFPGNAPPVDDLSYGYQRAKLAWYTIDPTFFTNQRPTGISDDDLSSNRTRRVYYSELYPVTDVAPGQTTVVNTLDLTYFPQERGPYNYNPTVAGTGGVFDQIQAEQNWGGIMRSITSTNFEQTNVEYIQFWVLDPYSGNAGDVADPTNTGMLEINLGEISEDILKDNRKQYENGLPAAGGTQPTFTSSWSRVPVSQSLIYAFDTDTGNRALQDVGLDGLSDQEEAAKFAAQGYGGYEDPSGDNYQFFLDADGDVINRYKNYNGTEGNSPVDVTSNSRGSTSLPDVEDINRDNTMNTIDAYYRYRIPIEPGVQPGQGYVIDARTFTVDVPGNNGDAGSNQATGRWLLYKVPIEVPDEDDEEYAVGGITNTRSIRFMRMFVSGFKEEITLRFGALDLVRGEWRRYTGLFDEDTDPDGNTSDTQTGFDVTSLNVQENGARSPINYVSPPGVVREQLYSGTAVINQNEQALSLRVYSTSGSGTDGGLEPGDSRAVFKNVNVDMRQFKKLRMFLHAEPLSAGGGGELEENGAVQSGELKAFIRFGNDFTDNYYQVEIKLDQTSLQATTAEAIWPEENEINLPLELLTQIKILAMQDNLPIDQEGARYADVSDLDPSLGDRMTVRIKGNPNFGLVRTLMVGVKNGYEVGDPGARNLRGEVWFNELRLSDMDSNGGMAALASMDTNFADFANFSATGRVSTIGFGTIEQGPNERSREDAKQYNVVTNLNLGQLLPKKWGINLPFNYGVGEEIITPEYDPFQQDVRLDQLIDLAETQAEKDNLKDRAIDYTKTKSINFIGVKKNRSPEQKPHVYDPENFTLSYSYNQTNHHDYEVEDLVDQQVRASVDYNYSFNSKPIEPLAKTKFMSKSQYWKLLRDFNFNYLPTSISFSSNILRQYNRQQFRNVDVEGIPIDPLYRRNYFFNYQYGFNYVLSKGLKFNYSVSTSNIVRNYLDENNVPIEDFTIWDDFWSVGSANQHTQQLTVNYEIPISKLPMFAFIKPTYTYNTTFNWQRSTDGLRYFDVTDVNNVTTTYDLGNLIQNSSSHNLNTQLNMDVFYKYIGLTGKKAAKNAKPKPQAPKPGQKVTNNQKTGDDGNMFLNGLVGVVTSVKNISVKYVENRGTVLPGYIPGIGFFGTTKPGLDFVLGSQGDIRYEMARNGYLTNYEDYNQNFTRVKTQILNMTASIDLFPDLKIELSADRTYSKNDSEQYHVEDGLYIAESPYTTGNLQMSTILISTAFSKSDVNSSEAFDQFRENRLVVANRLAEQRYGTTNFPVYNGPLDDNAGSEYSVANAGYPLGYGKNSQAVLLPAFLSAYSGQDASKVKTSPFRDVPLPNWVVKYTGLMRYKYFKERFKRFSLQHGYRASYNINSYRTNLEYESTPIDANGNFANKYIISNINLAEQFNPLIRVDMEMKNSIKILAEIKKDRTLNMSFDNNLLTEVKGNEYTVGLGYRIKDVTINSSLADNPTNVIKSDIDLKADFTLRKNETIVRYLDYDNNQLGGGQNIWSVKFTASYSFSKNLTAIFYYDHSFSKAVISTAYPLTNIRSGFTLRYNFGN